MEEKYNVSIIIKCLRMFQFANMNLEINEVYCTNKTAIKLKYSVIFWLIHHHK